MHPSPAPRKWKEERAKMGLQFSSGETFPDIHVAVVVVVVVSLLSWNGAGGIDLGGPLRKFTNWRVMLWLWRCKHTLIGGFMKYESCGKCRVAFVFTNTQLPKPFRMWAVTKADPYIISKAMHAWGCGNISVHLLSLCVRRIGKDTSHVFEEGERKSSFFLNFGLQNQENVLKSDMVLVDKRVQKGVEKWKERDKMGKSATFTSTWNGGRGQKTLVIVFFGFIHTRRSGPNLEQFYFPNLFSLSFNMRYRLGPRAVIGNSKLVLALATVDL